MKKGLLIYEREDIESNESFIHLLIQSALKHQLDLELTTSDSLTLTSDIHFCINRARDEAVRNKIGEAGIRSFNSTAVNHVANDKWLTHQLAQQLQIPTIPSSLDKEEFNFPKIIKSRHGHGGKDIYLCKDERDEREALEQLTPHTTIIQPYIETGARDVRIWVLGDTILGAVERQATTGFKSNYTLGGLVQPFEVPAVLEEYVEILQKTLKSDYIGIDFLQDPEGNWLLNEIEDPVGARSLYATTSINSGERFIDYIAQQLKA